MAKYEVLSGKSLCVLWYAYSRRLHIFDILNEMLLVDGFINWFIMKSSPPLFVFHLNYPIDFFCADSVQWSAASTEWYQLHSREVCVCVCVFMMCMRLIWSEILNWFRLRSVYCTTVFTTMYHLSHSLVGTALTYSASDDPSLSPGSWSLPDLVCIPSHRFLSSPWLSYPKKGKNARNITYHVPINKTHVPECIAA